MAYISDGDREALKKMFDEKLRGEVLITLFVRHGSASSEEAKKLLIEVSLLSEKTKLEVFDFDRDEEMVKKYGISRAPCIVLTGRKDYGMRYYGVPAGQEFQSLSEGIVYASTGTTELTDATRKELAGLEKPIKILVFVTANCVYCPRVVLVAWQFAVESDMVTVDVIDIGEFPEVKSEYRILATPKLVVENKGSITGARADEFSILDIIKTA